ncbi:hypothetical protein ACXWQN_09350, partial [Streptococcus pyogenes]
MYKLENTKKHKNTLLSLAFAMLTVSGLAFAKSDVAVDGGKVYPVKDGKYTLYYQNSQDIKDFGFGREA